MYLLAMPFHPRHFLSKANASESCSQKSPAAVNNNKGGDPSKTENKSPIKKIRRSLREEYDEIGLMAGFITEDQKPTKCLPNSVNLERLYQKSDELINNRQNFTHRFSQKKNSSGERLDNANLIDDLPSSYIEETLLLNSTNQRSVPSLTKRAKVSLLKRKTSLENYTMDENHGEETSSCNLVSQVTPPLTPERPSAPLSTSFSSPRSMDCGLHLKSLINLTLPESINSNNRTTSPLPFSSPSTSPLMMNGRSGYGAHQNSPLSAQRLPATSINIRPSFPSHSPSPSFIRRRKSSASSSTSSSTSSFSSSSSSSSTSPQSSMEHRPTPKTPPSSFRRPSESQINGHG